MAAERKPARPQSRARGRLMRAALAAALLAGTSGCARDVKAYPRVAMDRPSVKRLVAEEATRMGIPVSLALAVAHAESNFDPRAESRAGARGVMQVMPSTAWGEYAVKPDLLWNPRINVRLGLHFLGRLLARYRGRIDLALSYYNGGAAVGELPHARVLPSTARYVTRVQRLQRHYRHQLLQGEV